MEETTKDKLNKNIKITDITTFVTIHFIIIINFFFLQDSKQYYKVKKKV